MNRRHLLLALCVTILVVVVGYWGFQRVSDSRLRSAVIGKWLVREGATKAPSNYASAIFYDDGTCEHLSYLGTWSLKNGTVSVDLHGDAKPWRLFDPEIPEQGPARLLLMFDKERDELVLTSIGSRKLRVEFVRVQ